MSNGYQAQPPDTLQYFTRSFHGAKNNSDDCFSGATVVAFRFMEEKPLGGRRKQQTIKLNKEFKRLYYRGVYRAGPGLVVYGMKNRFGCNRIGITTGKKVGCAVRRSRARRVIRAAYTQLRESVPQGYDFIFVARAKTPGMKSWQLAKEMEQQISFVIQKLGEKKK